jgi:hypothetical protein
MSALFVPNIIAVFLGLKVQAAGLQFGGVPISSGQTVTAEVPLSAEEKLYASDATKNVPSHGVAVIAVPRNFEPHKAWPVLVVFSTSDFKRLNRNDLVDFYRGAALAQGWVILAGDGPEFVPNDTNGWRAAMTLAALDALHRSFPGVGAMAGGNRWFFRRCEARQLDGAASLSKGMPALRNLSHRGERRCAECFLSEIAHRSGVFEDTDFC